LLGFCAYCQSCRTVATNDMLFGYFRGTSWAEVASCIELLGKLLDDSSVPNLQGELEDEEALQLRSRLLADIIIETLPDVVLRGIITKTFYNISPLRIYRYDSFRRHAYDADFAGRAFPDAEDGVKFYEDVYDRLNNPWILQQGALYLKRLKLFDDAFQWIDKALLVSRGRKWAIQNTHAVILFAANIERKKLDKVAIDSLHQSMDILGDCYRADKRKGYHARSYADQAIRLTSRLGNEATRGYLEKARVWLNEELKTGIRERETRHLLRQVESKL
jgi:hypothetical protein